MYEAAYIIVCYALHIEVSNIVTPTNTKKFFAKCGCADDHQRITYQPV